MRLRSRDIGRFRWLGGPVGGAVLLAVAIAADSPSDEQLVKQAQIPSDGPGLVAYFRQRTVAGNDRQRIESLIERLGDPVYAVRERATADLIASGLPAVTLLRRAAATQEDVEVARRAERCLSAIERVPSATLAAAVARLIAKRKPEGAAGALLAYLPLADDEAVADEVRDALAAVALTGDNPDPLLAQALNDPQPVRRAAAAEALIRSRRPEVVAIARAALKDKNFDVRLRAGLALVTSARDKESVPALIDLLSDLPQGSAWRVEEVLIRMAGESAPQISLGDDAAARKACRDRWLAWWETNRDSVDLARLQGTPAMLGHTLLVLRNANGIGGQVVEMNDKQAVVWKVDGLQQPMDAAVVGKDRVVIADFTNHHVVERDFAGKKIWDKNVMLPVSLQRLPDGHTVVVSRDRVVEWDESQHEVFVIRRTQQDIVAATKARTGEVVLITQAGSCIRMDPKTHKEISPPFTLGGRPYGYGAVEVLPNGHILTTLQNSVAEFDTAGKQLWQAAYARPTSVQRLPNGNTLVCSITLREVAELDRSGKVVWKYQPPDNMTPWKARRR
ncbi:MAG TPA: HEAT repeat domain-containing protein [Gemmataceae bacterium]|nr:HEAT repeat domain-containing protein [Gemmataceae bacterium]